MVRINPLGDLQQRWFARASCSKSQRHLVVSISTWSAFYFQCRQDRCLLTEYHFPHITVTGLTVLLMTSTKISCHSQLYPSYCVLTHLEPDQPTIDWCQGRKEQPWQWKTWSLQCCSLQPLHWNVGRHREWQQLEMVKVLYMLLYLCSVVGCCGESLLHH